MVLNVGTAHLGEFGSREAIARAKGELVEVRDALLDELLVDGVIHVHVTALEVFSVWAPLAGRRKARGVHNRSRQPPGPSKSLW